MPTIIKSLNLALFDTGFKPVIGMYRIKPSERYTPNKYASALPVKAWTDYRKIFKWKSLHFLFQDHQHLQKKVPWHFSRNKKWSLTTLFFQVFPEFPGPWNLEWVQAFDVRIGYD